MFSDLKSLPYEDRLRNLGLWTLEERRNRADLLEIFKLVKGFSATSWTQFFRKAEGVTRGHSWLMLRQSMVSRTVYRKEDNVRWTFS